MTSKEALKRLWQETAPATYMKDFDKKECCDVIERDLEILDIFGKNLSIEVEHIINNSYMVTIMDIDEKDDDKNICIILNGDKARALKKWYENYNGGCKND